MYCQELNPESYAMCKANMLIKGQDIANIIFGNTLSADCLCRRRRRKKHVRDVVSREPHQ